MIIPVYNLTKLTVVISLNAFEKHGWKHIHTLNDVIQTGRVATGGCVVMVGPTKDIPKIFQGTLQLIFIHAWHVEKFVFKIYAVRTCWKIQQMKILLLKVADLWTYIIRKYVREPVYFQIVWGYVYYFFRKCVKIDINGKLHTFYIVIIVEILLVKLSWKTFVVPDIASLLLRFPGKYS